MQQKSLQRSTSEKSKLVPMKMKYHLKREGPADTTDKTLQCCHLRYAAQAELQNVNSNRTSPMMEHLITGCLLHSSAQFLKIHSAPPLLFFFYLCCNSIRVYFTNIVLKSKFKILIRCSHSSVTIIFTVLDKVLIRFILKFI